MEKDNKVTLISIILALVCIGILGYFIYFKLNKPIVKQPEEKPEKTEEKENTSENNEQVEQVNYEEIAKSLYAIIGTNPEFRANEIVTYESLPESVRDMVVLNKLSDKCENLINYDKEQYLSEYKNIFNQDKINEDGLCKVINNVYQCERYCDEFNTRIYNKFSHFETEEDKIIIYETAGHIHYADDSKIYLEEHENDSSAIASFDSIDELMNSTVEYKLPTYKHVFEKGETGYYWVSSELVKQ